MSLQEFIENLSREDLELIKKEFDKKENKIPTYSFSKIKFKDLEKLFDIEKNIIDESRFDNWFNAKYKISKKKTNKFQKLIDRNRALIHQYNEEDLKVKFIIPLLNKVGFLSYENEFRDFYELPITYKTDDFIFQGTTDFVVSKGLLKSKKPYFFIQKFKRDKEFSDPEPQLLAELIAGVELNGENMMRGAYIVGSYWNFVILEKLGEKKYQYFVSENFDSTKIADLKNIYKNLVFVREEILERVKRERG